MFLAQRKIHRKSDRKLGNKNDLIDLLALAIITE